MTAHSAFNIPVPSGVHDTCHLFVNSNNSQKLRDESLVIRVEIVICHRHCMWVLDSNLKVIMYYTILFGRNVLLFAGDFPQIISVVPSGSKAHVANIFSGHSFCTTAFKDLGLQKTWEYIQCSNTLHHLKKQSSFHIFYTKSVVERSRPMLKTISSYCSTFIKFAVTRPSATTSSKT